MPYAGADFGNVEAGKVVTNSFDFTGYVGSGETIVSAVWTAATAADSPAFDASAASTPHGQPSISSNIVSQQFSGLVANVKYLVTCTVTTNMGNTPETYSHFYVDTAR